MNLPNAFLLFFFLQWCMVYCLRLFGSSYRRPVLRDYLYLVVISLISSITIIYDNPVLKILLFLLLIIIFILQWLNIILLQTFRFKVNWPTIRVFFTGVGHFKDELQELWPTLWDEPKLLILPLWVILVNSALFFFTPLAVLYVLAAFGIYFIACFTKSRWNKRSTIFWLVAIILSEYLVFQCHVAILKIIVKFTVGYYVLSALLLLGVISGLMIARKKKSQFWQRPDLLSEQFRDDKLSLAALTAPPTLTTTDIKLADLDYQSNQKTELFNLCRNANVIFITVESLSSYYFHLSHERAREGMAEIMPWFTKLQSNALNSQCHITPSSLTNNALHAIYSGGYRERTTYPHLQLLRQHGYHTSFLSSQKVHEFNLDKLLQKIGFTQIIDNASLSKKRHHRITDPEFFARAPEFLEKNLTQPLFLQIINNQTHGPYFTYQEKYLDRKTRYLAAITEADQTLQTLVTNLGSYLDLQNTIIVYTADHGESFGEEGYTSHGNAIIQPQIQVPCLIYHPKLTAHNIQFSTHFDLMPTLLNLLGIDYTYQVLGTSLDAVKRAEHCLIYSESRMGNTPSSFGIITPQQKIYFDRMLEQYELRNLQDQVLQTLTGETYDYYLKLLLLALNNRGLIY